MLEFEQRRIIDFVKAERNRLDPELRRLSERRSSVRSFVSTAEAIFRVFDESLSSRLATTVESVAGYGADLASERLNELSTGIRATLWLLSSVVTSQDQIPEELYGVTTWFFRQCQTISEPPAYVLAINNSFYTEELRQFLRRFFTRPIGRELYEELTAIFSSNPFFFIFLPASSASIAGALDWPLVFHECVHAIEEKSNLVGALFPDLPRNWSELDQLGKVDEKAREAQQTLELICDHVATMVGGPAFAWRFLRHFFSLSGIFHQPSAHPNPDVRIAHLIALIAKQGFAQEAKRARALLKDVSEDFSGTIPPRPSSMPAPLAAAKKAYQPKIQPLTRKSFLANLRRRCGATPRELLNDVLAKRPVVLDPASLFTLVSFNDGCEADEKIPMILADFLRADSIRARFIELGLRG
jgi:hypothetical protein